MKISYLCLAVTLLTTSYLFADLTIVQKIDGGGPQLTLKFKGDLIRQDPSPEISAIINYKTGEMIHIMHLKKAFMEISAERVKTMREKNPIKPKPSPELKPSGEMEIVETTDGKFEAEKFTFETDKGIKGAYWIVKDYPNGAKILAEMNKLKGAFGSSMSAGLIPDTTKLTGFPIRSKIEFKGEKPVFSTAISVKDTPIDDADFKAPEGYQEIPLPE